MSEPTKIEYRVKPITRFVVTRYHETEGGNTGGVEERGEYDNGEVAFEVAYALAKAEHQRLGWSPGDDRIQYPRRAPQGAIIGVAGDAFPLENHPGNRAQTL